MIFKLKPIFVNKIWGGNYFKNNYDSSAGHNAGEMFACSGMKESSNFVKTNQTLHQIWQKFPNLFNNNNHQLADFPFLIKLIYAQDDLSIQAHPTNEYAQKFLNLPFGKHECWFVLNCKKNTKMVIGHHANSSDRLNTLVHEKKWKQLLAVRSIKKYDFIDVKPGTIHAICKDSFIYELQQPINVTFRLYDYDRKTADNKLRPLHIKEALANVYTPQIINPKHFMPKQNCIQPIFSMSMFSLDFLCVNGKFSIEKLTMVFHCFCITVIEGSGTINNESISSGESWLFTIDENKNLVFSGNFTLLIAKK